MLGGLFQVAAGLLERVLAVEHPGAGHLAQGRYVLGAVARHAQATSTGSAGAAPGAAAGRGSPRASSSASGRGSRLAPVLGDEAALDDGVGDDPAHQGTGTDGVVVARDDVVDDVGVAVGVDHGDHRQTEFASLGDRDVLLLRVDHEDRVGQPVQIGDAAEVRLESFSSSRRVLERLTLGHPFEIAGSLHGPQLLHALHPARHGGEVGQHASQPTLVDVRHAAGLGVVGHRALGLLLRPHEEDGPAVGHQVAHEAVRGLDAAERLAQVDEIDPVALTQDEALHLRVPSSRLVAEVDSGFQQLPHGNDGHSGIPPIGCSPAAAPPGGGDRGTRQVMFFRVRRPPAGGPCHGSRSASQATGRPALTPSGACSRRPCAAVPCSRACTPGWWPGWHGRAVPARPAGRRRHRGGGWRRCGGGRGGGWARRPGDRGCAGRRAGPRRPPRRFTKTASGGPAISSRPPSSQRPEGGDGGVVHGDPALLGALAEHRDGAARAGRRRPGRAHTAPRPAGRRHRAARARPGRGGPRALGASTSSRAGNLRR